MRHTIAFFANDNRIAVAGQDGTIWIWRPSGEAIELSGHTSWVSTLAVDPNGRRVASGSSDGTVRIWDSISGTPLSTLQGHLGRVTSVDFSPDGRWLASAAQDGEIHVWLIEHSMQVLRDAATLISER